MSQLETTQHPTSLPPQIVLMQMATSNWISQAVYVAAKLGIADLLKDGAKHCDELASLTKAHAPSLYRLLRALASLGVFAETDKGYFTLTSLAHYLRSDLPDSLRAMAIMNGEEHYQAWGELKQSVQTGKSAFEYLYGMQIFDYYAQNPESAAIFDQAMTSYSSTESAAVAESYDFSSIETLVDVAGGHGSLLTCILKANPSMNGILFDQTSVIEGAEPLLEVAGILSRCKLVSGDFFESVPAGGNAYILKHIIHDWGDEQALVILKHCYEAMPENGKLLLVEQVIPPGNEPFFGKLLDLNMLVMCPGGRERTETEYRALLEKASFKLTRIVPTDAPVSVVEGIRL